MKNKTLLKSVIVLVTICLVISAALAIVNSFTSPVIKAAAEDRENQSRQQLLPSAAEFRPLSLEGVPESVTAAYLGTDAEGNEAGYVFTAQGKGFNGTIVVMAAIDPEGKLVQVATMDVNSETKTLGGLTAKESYTSQYAGKDDSLDGVNAISGATITSKAYEQCVKDCFEAFRTVREG